MSQQQPPTIAAILDDRAAAGLTRDDRPDLYAGIAAPALRPPLPAWLWPACVGFCAGILAVCVPAIIVAALHG